MAAAQHDQVAQYKRSLFTAAKDNDGALIKSFLEDRLLHLNLVLNEEKQNLLHLACMGGAEDVLGMMLEYPKVLQKLDARDGQHRTPLHYAAAMGFDNIIDKLLSFHADLDPQDDKGATPLMLAIRFEWTAAARALLAAGANPMIEDYHGHNSVDLAISKEGEICDLLSSFAGRRRQTTLLQSLRNLVRPAGKLRPVPHLARDDEKDQSRGPLAPVFYDDVVGEHVPPPPLEDGGAAPIAEAGGPEQLSGALEEAISASGAPVFQGDSPDIQLDIQEPKPALGASTTHAFSFDESVSRLEFEVEWLQDGPAVGAVKPNGQAAKRGLLQGDQIYEIAGVATAGKARDDLLPLMKQRPLVLKVDRKGRVASASE